MKKAYVVGTCDTKFEELKFVADLIRQSGVEALLVDVGTKPH
ncbi:MAG TPA: Tm-1-like ATP-binding domain-containing protein, partial [Synergistales bacterium]|nr:Tm-1-like ATP-binding domain-containing protein [Synergistales bacterium]